MSNLYERLQKRKRDEETFETICIYLDDAKYCTGGYDGEGVEEYTWELSPAQVDFLKSSKCFKQILEFLESNGFRTKGVVYMDTKTKTLSWKNPVGLYDLSPYDDSPRWEYCSIEKEEAYRPESPTD